jgi:hypothetical protein
MKRMKVKYIRAITSPPSQAGVEGEVKFLPVGLARKLVAAHYVVVVKEDSLAKKRGPKTRVRVADREGE